MKIKELNESTTTSGSIAPGAPSVVGKTQKRAGSLFTGKVTNKPFYEEEESDTKPKKPKKDFGKMFQKKVDQSNKAKKDTEEKVKAHTVKEDEIVEQDLILVPGQIKGKDKSFIPHEKDRRDHEVEMARSELFAAAKDAQRIYAMLKSRTEDEGLMGWQQSYITLAADYLNSVADSLEHQAHTNEMTGGVLAGGMSNFEEGVAEKSHQERLDQRNAVEQIALHNRQDDYFDLFAEWSGKTRPEIYKDRNNHRLAYKLENLGMQIADYWPNQSYYKPGDPKREELYGLMKQWYDLYNKAYNELKKQGVAEEQAPMFTPEEEQLDEKKDACYSKVKSRYKVWPSAYASGALVKCRKVGASNWGNKSKK